jgi:Membrane protein involved in the export of O-antigen and teichoic acid
MPAEIDMLKPSMAVISDDKDPALLQMGLEEKALGKDHLDRSLVYGIAWTGVFKWTTQVLTWLSTLIIARLLSPEDYGLAAMATVYIAFVQLVNEFGISAAVVQRRDLTKDQVAKLGGLSMILGIGFFLVSVALSTPVAAFFGEQAVQPIVLVLSTTFILSGIQVLPRSLLTREFCFQRLAWIDAAEAITATVVTLLLAIIGFGYWALVIGIVAGRLISTVGTVISYRHPIAWPVEFHTIAIPVTFGAHMVVTSIAWFIFRNADIMTIGQRLGKTALGAYMLGWSIASIPIDRIGEMITRVAPAVFAAVQHDPAALRRYLLRLTEVITLATFPVAAGLALLGDEFVLLFLGEAWRPAIEPLRLLALAAIFRSVVPVLNQVLVATGHSKRDDDVHHYCSDSLAAFVFYWELLGDNRSGLDLGGVFSVSDHCFSCQICVRCL